MMGFESSKRSPFLRPLQTRVSVFRISEGPSCSHPVIVEVSEYRLPNLYMFTSCRSPRTDQCSAGTFDHILPTSEPLLPVLIDLPSIHHKPLQIASSEPPVISLSVSFVTSTGDYCNRTDYVLQYKTVYLLLTLFLLSLDKCIYLRHHHMYSNCTQRRHK